MENTYRIVSEIYPACMTIHAIICYMYLKCIYMGVSKNRGTPKSSILIGFSIINHPFWGFSSIFGNTHITVALMYTLCVSLSSDICVDVCCIALYLLVGLRCTHPMDCQDDRCFHVFKTQRNLVFTILEGVRIWDMTTQNQ